MSDFADHSTKADRETRKERAQLVTSGARDAYTHLTAAEADLLARLYAAGYEIATGRVANVRTGATWLHQRTVSRRIA